MVSLSSRLRLPFSFCPAGWGGIIPTGQARLRYPVPFFMVAIFFLIFDVEGAYIFSWAVASRPLGWAGWLQIEFFIGVLIAGLIYVWVKGGLEWGPKRD